MCLVPIFIPFDPDDFPDLKLPNFKWWQWLIVTTPFTLGFIMFVLSFFETMNKMLKINPIWSSVFMFGGLFISTILSIIFIEIS